MAPFAEARVSDKLRELLPPPEQPFFAAGDWNAVEAAIGTRLPADYKSFIGLYGAGCISRFLIIQSPFIWVAHGRNVGQEWANWASMYHDFAKYGGQEIPYAIFPQPGGLLPFGSVADSHFLNWRMVGDPERWPFVYYHRDKGFFEINGLSAMDFVLEAVTGCPPLLVLTGSESLFELPLRFAPYTGEAG